MSNASQNYDIIVTERDNLNYTINELHKSYEQELQNAKCQANRDINE